LFAFVSNTLENLPRNRTHISSVFCVTHENLVRVFRVHVKVFFRVFSYFYYSATTVLLQCYYSITTVLLQYYYSFALKSTNS